MMNGMFTMADNTDYLVLDDTDATADNATAWNDTSPSSTVFTVNTSHSVNADAEKYIAYCWRSIEGFLVRSVHMLEW